jgi:hypothetical protein
LIDFFVSTSLLASVARSIKRILQLSPENSQSISKASILTLFKGSWPSGKPESNVASSVIDLAFFFFNMIYFLAIMESTFPKSAITEVTVVFGYLAYCGTIPLPIPYFFNSSINNSLEMIDVCDGKTNSSMLSSQGINCSICICGG